MSREASFGLRLVVQRCSGQRWTIRNWIKPPRHWGRSHTQKGGTPCTGQLMSTKGHGTLNLYHLYYPLHKDCVPLDWGYRLCCLLLERSRNFKSISTPTFHISSILTTSHHKVWRILILIHSYHAIIPEHNYVPSIICLSSGGLNYLTFMDNRGKSEKHKLYTTTWIEW